MIPKTAYRDPNARPCDLNDHTWKGYTDGSRECRVCGIYIGPDIAMVEALIREGAGGAEYRRQAAALRMLMPLPVAPKPIPPPILKNVDGSHADPSWTLPLLTGAAFLFGIALALAWTVGVQVGDWLSK